MTEATKEKKDTTAPKKESVYSRLSKIDVSKFVSKKNGLNYLSWAKAWGLVKSIYPDANYKIKEYPNFVQTSNGDFQQVGTLDYRRTGCGVEVEASVTIQGQTYSSKLYVMDYHNRALAPGKVTYFEINKTQMRALTKALAFAGLGLNIYAGEDLPADEDDTPKRQAPQKRQSRPARQSARQAANRIAKDTARKTAYVKALKIPFGGGDALLTDVLGLAEDKDRDAPGVLQAWLGKDNASHSRHNMVAFIRNHDLVTHGKKAVPEQ